MDTPKTHGSPIMITVLAVAEFALMIGAWYYLSQIAGTKDTANDLTKTVLPATGIIIAIVLIHTALWYMYFTYVPTSMNVYFLLSTSCSMIVSLTALSLAIVSKS
jgi:hypothetical protein